MHRSAFGGRNYEYHSEDGILAGKMAAADLTFIVLIALGVVKAKERKERKEEY